MNKIFEGLKKPWSRRHIVALLCTAPCLSVLSYFLVGLTNATTPDLPGGRFLEIAFWLTSFGTAFLSFIMLEILFRSRETKLLAPWPVPPLRLLSFQMLRVCRGILVSSVLFFFFWLPQLIAVPSEVVILCLLLWPASLTVCATISSSIIIYTGNSATQKEDGAHFGAQAFAMAPAIALAVSLMTTLLLKLLVEALLKPNFVHAAITATTLVVVIFLIATVYTVIVYRRRYYAILASFNDSDGILLNAEYSFIDGQNADKIQREPSILRAIAQALAIQYRRRYPMASIVVVLCALIMALFLWKKPEFLSFYVPLFAQIPWLIFAKPWFALEQEDLNTGLMAFMPIEDKTMKKAKILACFKLMFVQAILVSCAVAIPFGIHQNGFMGIVMGISTFALCAFLTYICASVVIKTTRS